MQPGWYIFTIPLSRQRQAVEELREAGLDVVWLFCFAQSLRAHRTVKRRRPDMHRPVPALFEHVFIYLASDADAAAVEALELGIRRMPLSSGKGLFPRLSAKGVAWLQSPPPGLMYDTDVVNLQLAARTAKCHLKVGDRVGVFTYPFLGRMGEVIGVFGDRARVHFDDSFFDFEVPQASARLVG